VRRLAIVLAVLLAVASVAQAQTCTPVKIQSGTLVAADGVPLRTGYDQWGYNYQAHIFNGLYENFSRPTTPVTEGAENLVMKWSDDWLANIGCAEDGTRKLARGYDAKTGTATGISRGWCTNHFEGDYEADGEMHHYTYFVKMVWVGPPPTEGTDPWAGKRIWGVYAIIEEVNNDPYGGFHGVTKDALVNPAGLGVVR